MKDLNDNLPEMIMVPKALLDDILSDMQGFARDKPYLDESDDSNLWYNWLNDKVREIKDFRQKYILGQANEIWAITRTNYFNAGNYDRNYQGREYLCEDFPIFDTEEKAIEAFNKFRLDHEHEKRFRSGPRWFSYKCLSIDHYAVKLLSEYDLKELRGENEPF